MTIDADVLETTTNIDPVWLLEKAFHDMLRSVFQHQGARLQFGFSQVSFFHNREGLPAWYLWFGEKKGAYKIQLTNASLVSFGSDGPSTSPASFPSIRGNLAIHYYPSEGEEAFDSYSCFEKLIRLSPLFDHTGTPFFQREPEIPVTHFVVGHIDVRTTPCHGFLDFECVAPERWLDFRTDGLYLKADGQKNYQVLTPGEKDRDIPGWNLSWFLFNKIIFGFCYHHRFSPSEVFLFRKDGYRSYIDRDNRVRKSGDCSFSEFRLVAKLAAFEEQRDVRHAGHHHMHACDESNLKEENLVGIWQRPDTGMPQWVNAEWWNAKDMAFPEEAISHCCQDI
jgi:hypothetical protein